MRYYKILQIKESVLIKWLGRRREAVSELHRYLANQDPQGVNQDIWV